MKKALSFILSFVIALTALTALPAFADTELSEVRITCSVSSVSPGTLPTFTASSNTAHVSSIDPFGSNTNWSYWGGSSWIDFGASTPTAVDDGKTHYALAICVNLEDGYKFGENTKIYLNGTEYTSLGHSGINAMSWGGYVYFDLGTAGTEIPIYTITYNANGGTGNLDPQKVYEGESKHLRGGNELTPPKGMSFDGWKINGVTYEQYESYSPTSDVTAYAVWTDKYIRESKATMAPSTITADICANDLVFTSLEPSKYSVALWRVFDETDKSLNTSNKMYPFDKKFITGHQYAIEFQFKAAGNYYEYDKTTNISTFYLNGNLTEMSSFVSISGATERRIVLVAGEDPAIKTVNATVTTPVAGGELNNKPVISTANVNVIDYDWLENGEILNKTFNTFKAGHTYRLQILASTTKKFNNNSTAMINGKAATVKNYSNNSILFYCDFTLPAPSGFTVSYNSNGGSGSMTSDTGVIGAYPLPSCGFTAPGGKEFKCWSVGGVEKIVGEKINVTADTVVTALWQDVKPSHIHDFEILRSDADYHWFECACGTKKYADIHSFKTVVAPATFDTPGSFIQECSVCGYQGDVQYNAIPALKSISISKTTYTYNGKVQRPSVKLLDSKGKPLNKNYYTVVYSNSKSKNVGTYKVKITLKGYYYGQKTFTYKINPKGTTVSKAVSPKKSQLKVTWKKQAAQTTGYQIQYSLKSNFKKAKTLTISKNKTTSKTITKLKKGKKYYIRIRTYKKIGNKKYYSSWKKFNKATKIK